MLKIENLHVYYGGIHALQGINLEVPDRQIISLIGANGAGKSTSGFTEAIRLSAEPLRGPGSASKSTSLKIATNLIRATYTMGESLVRTPSRRLFHCDHRAVLAASVGER